MPVLTGSISQFGNTAHTNETMTGASGAFAFAMLEPGGFEISYTIGGTAYTADDRYRDGKFWGYDASGNVNCQGTIDYATGVWTVSFPLGGPDADPTANYMEQDGLLATVLDFILGNFYENEIADSTADGSKLAFSGTLVNFPNISKGQVEFGYTIAGQKYNALLGTPARDDGAGLVQGINIDTDPDTTLCTGTIDYTTGAWTLTFASGNAPDNGTDIVVDYVVGVPGRDWKPLRERAVDYTFPRSEIVFKNSGLSGREDVICGLREGYSTANGAWHWHLNVYTQAAKGSLFNINFGDHGYDAYDSGWDIYTELPLMPLWDGLMNYWVYSNKQRIIVIVEISGDYQSMYMGFSKRLGPPSTYPHPNFAIGSLCGTRNYGSTASQHRWCLNPYYASGTQYGILGILPGGTYSVTGPSSPNYLLIRPVVGFTNTGQLNNTSDGRVVIHPVYVMDNINGVTLVELDGIYFCPSNQLSVEDVITQGADTFKVFINIRDINYYSFMCIREM